MQNLDDCILTSICDLKRYFPYLDRLVASCNTHGLKINAWYSHPSSSQTHNQSPYGYKYHAIRDTMKFNRDIVIYADTPAYITKTPYIFRDLIREKGLVFLGGVDSLCHWVNDRTLKKFGYTREDILEDHMITGSLFGFDFSNSLALEFFEQIEKYEKEGWFQNDGQPPIEPFRTHRSDEAVISLLLKQYNIKQLPAYTYFQSDNPLCTFKNVKDL